MPDPTPHAHKAVAHAAPKSRSLSPPVVRRRGAYLPHWTQEGATYFVTYRLADSLPAAVLRGWVREREGIIRRAEAMGCPLTKYELARLDELHSDRIERWLDAGHGACHLHDPRLADLIRDAMLHFHDQRYRLIVWCVMPNHVHAVLTPIGGFALSWILQSWKGFTGRRANQLLGRTGAFWQPEPYDHLIRDADDLSRIVRYVLDNPARAGLRDWRWVGLVEPGDSPTFTSRTGE